MSSFHFADDLLERVRGLEHPCVVGLDPDLARMPKSFVAGRGADPEAAARARGLLVILDAKRGDIGSTSEAYAASYLSHSRPKPMTVDALTLSPYLGRDSIEPFVARARDEGVGLFICVKTSNAGSWSGPPSPKRPQPSARLLLTPSSSSQGSALREVQPQRCSLHSIARAWARS